jgi:hypothetical protein
MKARNSNEAIKGCEMGIANIVNKTGLTSDVKGGIEEYTNESLARNLLPRHEHPRPFKLN